MCTPQFVYLLLDAVATCIIQLFATSIWISWFWPICVFAYTFLVCRSDTLTVEKQSWSSTFYLVMTLSGFLSIWISTKWILIWWFCAIPWLLPFRGSASAGKPIILFLNGDALGVLAYSHYTYAVFGLPAVGKVFMESGFLSEVYGYNAMFDYMKYPPSSGVFQVLPLISVVCQAVEAWFFLAQGLQLFRMHGSAWFLAGACLQVTMYYLCQILMITSDPQRVDKTFIHFTIGHLGTIWNYWTVAIYTVAVMCENYGWWQRKALQLFIILFVTDVSFRTLMEVNEAMNCVLISCPADHNPDSFIRAAANLSRWVYLVCSPVIPLLKSATSVVLGQGWHVHVVWNDHRVYAAVQV